MNSDNVVSKATTKIILYKHELYHKQEHNNIEYNITIINNKKLVHFKLMGKVKYLPIG